MRTPRLFEHNGALAGTSGNWVNLSGLIDMQAYDEIHLCGISVTTVDLRTLQCLSDGTPVVADDSFSTTNGNLPGDGVISRALKTHCIVQYKNSGSSTTGRVELTGKLPYGNTSKG